MGREELEDEILQLEWNMFTSVPNEGGRAACQDNKKTFEINRRAQLITYSDRLVECYLDHLRSCRQTGRNLMTEKYGYMMADTAPEEFKRIQALLPPVSSGKEELLDKILSVHIAWEQELRKKYPVLRGQGRGDENIGSFASFQTYLRSELATWNETCLTEYSNELKKAVQRGENLAEKTLSFEVQAYGYESLSQAEQKLKEENP